MNFLAPNVNSAALTNLVLREILLPYFPLFNNFTLFYNMRVFFTLSLNTESKTYQYILLHMGGVFGVET